MTNRAVSRLDASDSLQNVTEELARIRIILQNKKDSWKDQEFSDILNDYFGNISLPMLELCSSMISSSTHASRLQSSVKSALDSFQEKYQAVSYEDSKFKNFPRYFLENVWTTAHLFPMDLLQAYCRVYLKQIAMMARLEAKMMKLERMLDELIARRKASIRILMVTFGLVLVCSVVSVYVKASPVLAALIAAVMIFLGWIGKWLNSTWKICESNFREQIEIIFAMQTVGDIVFHEWGCTAALFERFQIETEELLTYASLTTWEDEAGLVAALVEIKRRVDDNIVKTIHDL